MALCIPGWRRVCKAGHRQSIMPLDRQEATALRMHFAPPCGGRPSFPISSAICELADAKTMQLPTFRTHSLTQIRLYNSVRRPYRDFEFRNQIANFSPN